MELHIPKNLLALNYLLFKKLLTAFAVLYVQCDLHRTRTSGLNHSRWFISALFSFQGTPPSAVLSLSESAFISYLIQFFLSRTFFQKVLSKAFSLYEVIPREHPPFKAFLRSVSAVVRWRLVLYYTLFCSPSRVFRYIFIKIRKKYSCHFPQAAGTILQFFFSSNSLMNSSSGTGLEK